MKRNDMSLFYAGMFVTLLLVVIVVLLVKITDPYCPQEDSCHVDYSNGRWLVIED